MPRPNAPTDGTAVALTDAEIDRVDAVSQPATGLPFLIIKAADPDADTELDIEVGDEDGADADTPDDDQADEPADLTDAQDDGADSPDQDVDESGDAADPQGGDEPAQPDAGAADARIPGSPAWEAADSAAAHQVSISLAGLRQCISALADREAAEAQFGQKDGASQSTDLRNAASMLDAALTILAKYAYAESASAAPTDVAAAVAKSADVWTRLLSPQEADVLTEAQIRAIAAEEVAKHTGGRVAKSAPTFPTSPEGQGQAPDDYASVFKSVLGAALEPVIANQERVADVLAAVEERVATVEKARMPGGPLLRGAAGVSPDGLWTVQRGAAEVPAVDAAAGTEALRKALSDIKDPRVRDAAGQAVATGLHPLLNSQP